MNNKERAQYILQQLTERGATLPENAAFCIEIALSDLEIIAPQSAGKTRQAVDPDGSDITWHMFFVGENNNAMALIEKAGVVRTCPATWVQFTDRLPSEV